MEASRKTYEPTAKEISKAQKIAAQPSPAKWTPAKAQARRWAGMILDSARGVPDAWLYYECLAGPQPMTDFEKRFPWAQIDSVNQEIELLNVLARTSDSEIDAAVAVLQEVA